MNLTKHNGSAVDIEGSWHANQLFITLTRTDHYDHEVSNFKLALDDIDLEHFISTLIEFQR
jgi:hypothetical protein